MYDISTLVDNGVVRAGASMFPVVCQLDSFGESPTRFTLAQIPPEEDVETEWVAVVWKGNPHGGQPIVVVAEKVLQILAFSQRNVQLLLQDHRRLGITPSNGCGCGSALKTYRGWPGARLSSVPVPKP